MHYSSSFFALCDTLVRQRLVPSRIHSHIWFDSAHANLQLLTFLTDPKPAFQQAGEVVLPEPEVRRVALPSKGARLIIASDGLWDALNPKTAVHHVRGMTAGKAAGELVCPALPAAAANQSNWF